MGSTLSVFQKIRDNFDVEKILKVNSIIDVAREFGLNVGKNVIPCIKKKNHVDQNGPPTMTLNLIKNTFRCWVCSDVGGDVIDLVMQVKNVDRDKAIQFLSIRSEIKSESERNGFFSDSSYSRLNSNEREAIFSDFLSGLGSSRGIDLIAFASTKGGTGKTLLVNNLAVIISLITRYIGNHRERKPQNVELIDLDFGKPDQRLLLGIEPEYYIEDIFYHQSGHYKWDLLRQDTPADNLIFISSCPVRKSNSLYYLKKNEILYMLHNSDAGIKLADFGASSDKDTLDFLSSIKSKVFVINPDRASVEAAFNLILSLLYYPMKQQFKNSSEAMNLLEKLRTCRCSGFTMGDMREGLRRVDKARSEHDNIKHFFEHTIYPFRQELGIPDSKNGKPTLEAIRKDLPLMQNKVHQIIFNCNSVNGDYSYAQKRRIYRTIKSIEQSVRKFDSFSKRLEGMLQTSLFGLIINKCNKEEADSIAGELVNRISDLFSLNLFYLGHIPEAKALRNISNYQMPFIVFDPEHSVLSHFYSITDTIVGLKDGSTAKLICDQKGHLASLKMEWADLAEHASRFL